MTSMFLVFTLFFGVLTIRYLIQRHRVAVGPHLKRDSRFMTDWEVEEYLRSKALYSGIITAFSATMLIISIPMVQTTVDGFATEVLGSFTIALTEVLDDNDLVDDVVDDVVDEEHHQRLIQEENR